MRLLPALFLASLIALPSRAVQILTRDILALEVNQGIIHIDPVTSAQTLVATGTFVDFAVTSRGELFALVGDAVVRIDPDSGDQVVVASDGHFDAPNAIATDAFGNLYVLDRQAAPVGEQIRAEVVRVDPITGDQSVVFESPFHVDFGQNDMVFDADGSLVVLDDCFSRRPDCSSGGSPLAVEVIHIDLSLGTEELVPIDKDLDNAAGVGTSIPGHVVLALSGGSFAEGFLDVDLETGESERYFGGSGDVDCGPSGPYLCRPFDGTREDLGTVIAARYVLEETGIVYDLVRFTSETGVFERLAIGRFTEVEVVRAPVPEPSTAALLVLGLGIVALRRGRMRHRPSFTLD